MGSDLFDRFSVIDVDTHVTEPADTWTSRVSKKWGDKVPQLVRLGEKDVWIVNGEVVSNALGGGICTVSTLLYRAAWWAGSLLSTAPPTPSGFAPTPTCPGWRPLSMTRASS